MPVSLAQWRGEVGIFYGKSQVFFNSSTCCSVVAPSCASICHNLCFTKLLTLFLISFFSGILLSYHEKINGNVLIIKPYIRSVPYFLITWSLLKYIWHDSRITILSGDIETNPGPKQSFSSQGLKICNWNLDNLSLHMYRKVSLLSVFISVHKLDIICLSETYLNYETSPDDNNLEIPGYNIIRKNHPSNIKRGGVCVYYKTLPFKLINIKYLQECITFEVRIGRKYCKFICRHRSPSQTNDKFDSFLKNFELTLDKIHEDNPFMISILGDFNAKSNNWCKNDTTSHEGSMIDAVTSNYGLHQLIQEPTHILNLSSSCIELIFTFQPNLVMESGVHSSLHPNCHHDVVFVKFNLSILYPPPYGRTVPFYKKANPELIRRGINELDWIKALSNVSIDEEVLI